MRRRIVIATVSVFLSCLLSGSVFAKEVCVKDNFGLFWRLNRGKALDSPGKALPLAGIYDVGGLNAPVSGSVIILSKTVLRIGVFVHGAQAAQFSSNLTATVQGDQQFNASGVFDNNGDFFTDGVMTWTPVDCQTLPALTHNGISIVPAQ